MVMRRTVRTVVTNSKFVELELFRLIVGIFSVPSLNLEDAHADVPLRTRPRRR
jgi:hypothetical protein